MATIQVKGLKELQERLREIGSVSGSRAMRSAMFAASRPILAKAKATAPARSGALREALARTFGVKTASGSIIFGTAAGSRFSIMIGPKVRARTAIALYNLIYKRRRPRRGIYHGHFLEFGTRTGTKATHWLRNALESTAAEATQELARALKRRIESIARQR